MRRATLARRAGRFALARPSRKSHSARISSAAALPLAPLRDGLAPLSSDLELLAMADDGGGDRHVELLHDRSRLADARLLAGLVDVVDDADGDRELPSGLWMANRSGRASPQGWART